MFVVKLPSQTKNTKLSFAHLGAIRAKVGVRENKAVDQIVLIQILYA